FRFERRRECSQLIHDEFINVFSHAGCLIIYNNIKKVTARSQRNLKRLAVLAHCAIESSPGWCSDQIGSDLKLD
ncbi:hypothetical protein SB781_40325, partial [Paraburkholderia sp. SIMBA_061]